MRKCAACGFINTDAREHCLKCTAPLSESARANLSSKNSHSRFLDRLLSPQSSFAWRWAMRVWAAGARIFHVPLPRDVSHRFVFVAALLGIFPGIGQLYNLQPRKTLFFMPAFCMGLALSAWLILTPWLGNLAIAFTIAIMAWSCSDALLTAAEINGQFFSLRARLAAFFYPIFMLGFLGTIFAVLVFFGFPIITLFYVAADYMAPALNRGDRICGEAVSYMFRKPRPGDVVRYDPPGFRIEIPGEISSTNFIVNPINGWERVMALPSETLERRDGRFYVDGRPLSKEYYPLLTDELPRDMLLTCPPDRYLVLITSRITDAGFINQLRAMAGTGSREFTIPPFDSDRAIFFTVDEFGQPQPFENVFFIKRSDIHDRAVFRYQPAERRRFLQARGPRFED